MAPRVEGSFDVVVFATHLGQLIESHMLQDPHHPIRVVVRTSRKRPIHPVFGPLDIRHLDRSRLPSVRFLAQQTDPQHGRGHRRPHQAVQPMVIGLLRSDLPFIHGSATAGRLDPVFACQVVRQQPVLGGILPKQRQAATIPNVDRQPCLDERFPEVGVEDHMPPIGSCT